MSREQFGPMGALLDERELALTLAAIGALYQRRDVDAGLAELLAAKDSGFGERVTAEHGRVIEVPVRLRALQAYVRDSRAWQTSHLTPMPWQDLQSRFKVLVPAGARLRLRIDLAGAVADAETKLDVAWLARVLGTPSFDACGVYVSQPLPEAALTWEWPLRIGVPHDAGNSEFRDALAAGRYRPLYEMADVETDGTACDLLLIPAGLRDAIRIAGRLPVRASAAIVVGGTTDSARDTEIMLHALRERLRLGAVAIAHVPSAERVCWFDALLAEISHNGTLDMALMLASRAQTRNHFRGAGDEGFDSDLTPPLVEADRSFIARAVMDELARRIGQAARSVARADAPAGLDHAFTGLPTAGPGATVKSVADQLATSAEKVAWHHETGDARVLAEFRRRVEGITSAPLVVPPLLVGTPGSRTSRTVPQRAPTAAIRGQRAKPPVAEALPPERVERSLLTELSVQSGSGEWTPTGNRMTAGATCALDTFIGLPREGVVAPSQPIPEKTLPPSATGHHLTIAFIPLWRGPDNAFPAAQTKGLDLPPTGDSPHVTFYFTAPTSLPDFRARLIVLFGFRVLQTLILDAPAGALRLEVENRVSNDFGERSEAPPFEAALIVNDNPQGIPGITTLAADGATFIEPEGLDVLVGSIRKQLKVLNLEDEAPALDDEAVESLLRTLAAYGADLARKLKNQPQMSAVLGVRRLQVVDARQGAYLPVEFFYDGKAPLPGAKRCENAIAALENLEVHAQCEHNRDAKFFCPAAFWGFSRCLERQPFAGRGVTVFRQPRPGANTLRPLEKALLAASQKVRAEDLDPPAGIETILSGAATSVARAGSWQDWQSKVTSESPSLLVLLPHSLDSPEFPGMPALEISGTNLASANVESDFVTPSPERTPVVLLLGCSTALPDIPFLNFVGQFKDSGAALVIGTIATIRGRQVGSFVRTLLTELRSAAAAGGGTFDEVFLRVKQRLLAAGDPFVLSLMAYGDTGWRIQV